jgi:predicted nucleic acid-binding protein
MDKIIISDTSCLIALSKIDKLDLLKGLYREIIITTEVFYEFGGALPDWILISEVKDKQKQQELE